MLPSNEGTRRRQSTSPTRPSRSCKAPRPAEHRTIKFLADENFDHKTLAGLKRREPDLDIVAVQEVGLREVDDPQVLEWAAREERIVLTHVSTFADFAYGRVAAGLPVPGRN